MWPSMPTPKCSLPLTAASMMAQAWGLSGGATETRWCGLDAGSPFDYTRAGILYIAAHLPPGLRLRRREDRALIALQGPRAAELVAGITGAGQQGDADRGLSH